MLNQITVMGRLTAEPDIRQTQSGITVTNFTVAVERDYGESDGGKKATDFIGCVAWRQTAEFISKYFGKGRLICVTGSLQSRKWVDNDGNNRTSWEIKVDHAYFTGEKAAAPAEPVLKEYDGDYGDGDVPF